MARNDFQEEFASRVIDQVARVKKLHGIRNEEITKLMNGEVPEMDGLGGILIELFDEGLFDGSNPVGNAMTQDAENDGDRLTIGGNAVTPTTGNWIKDGVDPMRFDGQTVQAPSGGGRVDYAKQRIKHSEGNDYKGFVSVPTSGFHFINGQSQNQFSPDYAPALIQFQQVVKDQMGIDKMQINSAFRNYVPSGGVQWSYHRTGMSVDIGIKGDKRIQLADLAWSMGFRGVAIGGTFVHVDGGVPGPGWDYPGGPGVYNGPGSV